MAACSVLSPPREQPVDCFLGCCPGRWESSSQEAKEKVECITPHPRWALTPTDDGTLPSPFTQRKGKTRATPVFWWGLGLLVCVLWGWSIWGRVFHFYLCETPIRQRPSCSAVQEQRSCCKCARMGSYLWLTGGEYIFFNNNDYKERFLRACCSWWACQAAGMTWPILLAFQLCLPICSGSLWVCSERHLMLIGTNSPPQWGEFTYIALC